LAAARYSRALRPASSRRSRYKVFCLPFFCSIVSDQPGKPYQLLLNAAELHVLAGTASIVVAAAPLVSVAIATLFLGEQLTPTRVAGSVVAIGGVVASLWHGRERPSR
jgi:drug/metabolite transporter (DMT)-like permease